MRSPRYTFITVYGHPPVLKVLTAAGLEIDKIVLATNAEGASSREILLSRIRTGDRLEPHR